MVTEEQTQRITAIVKARVRIVAPLFAQYPAFDKDDLFQDAMIRAIKAHETYKPPHAYTTWVGNAAHGCLLDALKSLRRKKRAPAQQIHLGENGGEVSESVKCIAIENTPETFAKLAVYLGRKLLISKPTRGQRYEHAQMSAIGALKQDRRWSYRGMLMILDTPAMRTALELDKIPHFRSVCWYEKEHRDYVSKVLSRTRMVMG